MPTTKKAPPAKKAYVVRTCPHCGRHTLIARGQFLVCRSCQLSTWRSAS
jgi:ribosomal protein S14